MKTGLKTNWFIEITKLHDDEIVIYFSLNLYELCEQIILHDGRFPVILWYLSLKLCV